MQARGRGSQSGGFWANLVKDGGHGGGRGGPAGGGRGVPRGGRVGRAGFAGGIPPRSNYKNSSAIHQRSNRDLASDVDVLRMSYDQLNSRMNRCERDIRCNDIRIYGVPIDKDVSLVAMINRVFAGMKFDDDTIKDLFSSVVKYDRKKDGAIVVSLGSAADKELVWNNKKNLKDFDNPWIANKPISVTHNYSSDQSAEAQNRKMFRQHLVSTGKYKDVKCVGISKISLDGAEAVRYDKL